MEISFNIGLEDAMEFHKYHMANDDNIRFKNNFRRYFIPAVILVVIMTCFDSLRESTIIFLLITGLLWMAFIPRLFMRAIFKATEKVLSDPLNRNFFGQRKLTFDNDRFIAETELETANMKRDVVVRFVQTAEYYFLYINAFSAITIPKSALTDEQKTFIEDFFGKPSAQQPESN